MTAGASGRRGGDAEPSVAYPSPDAREDALDGLCVRLGVSPLQYGESAEGRPLRGVRLPLRPGPRDPAPAGAARLVCVAANIHGVEYIGNRVAMAVLEALAEPLPGTAAERLRARAEVLVLPCLNPDGYHRTWAQAGHGAVAELRRNARGVDLNRNFPLPTGVAPSRMPAAGSDRPGAATYRGPAPLSEPESAAIDRLLADERPAVAVNLHSCMGTLIPARTRDVEDFQVYRDLCAAAVQAQPRWAYRRVSSRLFDVFTGEQEDRQHHAHGTWATCLETFPIRASLRQFIRPPRTFWRFNPLDPTPWIHNDVPAVLAFLLAGLEVGRRPSQHAGTR